jgi:hypothetical protein
LNVGDFHRDPARSIAGLGAAKKTRCCPGLSLFVRLVGPWAEQKMAGACKVVGMRLNACDIVSNGWRIGFPTRSRRLRSPEKKLVKPLVRAASPGGSGSQGRGGT